MFTLWYNHNTSIHYTTCLLIQPKHYMQCKLFAVMYVDTKTNHSIYESKTNHSIYETKVLDTQPSYNQSTSYITYFHCPNTSTSLQISNTYILQMQRKLTSKKSSCSNFSAIPSSFHTAQLQVVQSSIHGCPLVPNLFIVVDSKGCTSGATASCTNHYQSLDRTNPKTHTSSSWVCNDLDKQETF